MKMKMASILAVILVLQGILIASPALAVPLAPSNLTATIVSARQVNLTWQDNATDEKEFRVERANDAAFTTGLRTFKANSSAGTGGLVTMGDNSVVAEQTFFYRVFALDNAGAVSAPSNPVQVVLVVPVSPSNLTAVVVGPNQVNLTWIDNATNEITYDVDRATDANFVTRVSFEFLPANTTSFADTTAQPGTTYFYRVQATNAVGDSPLSNVVTVTTPTAGAAPLPPPPPAAVAPAVPTGVVATAAAATQVNLSWADSDALETGFRIERSIDGTTFTAVGVVVANILAYSDPSAVASTTYTYRVIAFNAVGDSAPATASPVTTPAASVAAPPAPAPPAGGGGGGGGGAAPPPPATSPVTVTGLSGASPRVNDAGILQQAAALNDASGQVNLSLEQGTKMLDSAGKSLPSLSMQPATSPPAPPPQRAIIAAFDFGPSGAQFDPAITLTLAYDPAKLPSGVGSGDLAVAFWDGNAWQQLESTVNPGANTISARVAHFTPFAVMAKLPPPPPAAPAQFSVSDLSISPASVKSGETVTISATVSNTGGSAGKVQVVLKIDGVQEATQEVSLNAGANQKVGFPVKKSAAGTYSVGLEGLGGQFTVTAEPVAPLPAPGQPAPPPAPEPAPVPAPAAAGTPGLLIGLVAGAVIIAGLLVYLLGMRKRGVPDK